MYQYWNNGSWVIIEEQKAMDEIWKGAEKSKPFIAAATPPEMGELRLVYYIWDEVPWIVRSKEDE